MKIKTKFHQQLFVHLIILFNYFIDSFQEKERSFILQHNLKKMKVISSTNGSSGEPFACDSHCGHTNHPRKLSYHRNGLLVWFCKLALHRKFLLSSQQHFSLVLPPHHDSFALAYNNKEIIATSSEGVGSYQ